MDIQPIVWCVYCRREIPPHTDHCPYCWKAMADGTRVIQCPSCGAYLLKSAARCQRCGKETRVTTGGVANRELTASEKAALVSRVHQESKKAKQSGLVTLAALSLVFILVGAVSFGIGNGSNTPTPAASSYSSAASRSASSSSSASRSSSSSSASSSSVSVADCMRRIEELCNRQSMWSCKVKRDGNIVTVQMWSPGLALSATSALLGDAASLRDWNDIAQSTVLLCNECQKIFDRNSHREITVTVTVMNDVNRDNVILGAASGILFYDYVNGINIGNVVA